MHFESLFGQLVRLDQTRSREHLPCRSRAAALHNALRSVVRNVTLSSRNSRKTGMRQCRQQRRRRFGDAKRMSARRRIALFDRFHRCLHETLEQLPDLAQQVVLLNRDGRLAGNRAQGDRSPHASNGTIVYCRRASAHETVDELQHADRAPFVVRHRQNEHRSRSVSDLLVERTIESIRLGRAESRMRPQCSSSLPVNATYPETMIGGYRQARCLLKRHAAVSFCASLKLSPRTPSISSTRYSEPASQSASRRAW